VNKKGIIGLFVGCLLVVAFFAYRFVTKSDAAKNERIETQETSQALPAITKSPELPPPPPEERIVPRLPDGAPVNPRFKQLVDELSKTYRLGGLPARIRIQAELAELWKSEPPSVENLLDEIQKTEAPQDHRVYFAKVLRNQIKRRAYDTNELAVAVDGLQTIIKSEPEDALFRSEVAMILTTVDQSDKTIESVLPLINNPSDETATRAVAALCNTTSPLAIKSLYTFVQDYENLEQVKPMALAAALAPLSTVDSYDIVPVIQGVVSSTEDFNLMRTSLQCLMRVPSSQATITAILIAYDSASKIPEQTAYIQYLSKAALEKHASFLRDNKSKLDQATMEKLQRIRGNQ
jgi:hypothetical protein